MFNTSNASITRNVELDYKARGLVTLAGACPTHVTAPGSATIELPAFGWAVCELVDR